MVGKSLSNFIIASEFNIVKHNNLLYMNKYKK